MLLFPNNYSILVMIAMLSLEAHMATLTIRSLEDSIKKALRIRAAINDRSMEEEARIILRTALNDNQKTRQGLGTIIHQRFVAEGGLDLETPDRSEQPSAASFLELSSYP